MSAVADNLIRVANKSQQWARDRPLFIDIGFAAALFVLELIDLSATDEADVVREPDLVAVLLIAVGASALIWRRITPTTGLLVASAAMIAFYIRDYGSFMSVVGLSAFYAAAAHAAKRRRAWIIIFGAACTLFGVAALTLLDRPDGFAYSSAASMSTYIALAIFVGVVMRHREQIFMKAEARADRAEADRSAAAERAVTEERLRIAREMHDVVAHGMSVISVQASAAQEIAHHEPERAIELMRSVEATGRESLVEMRRMLGVLRNGSTIVDGPAATRSPQPSLNDLETVIAHCHEAGLATELIVTGPRRPLAAGLELAVFRIVQEALTNVLKHGGSTAKATVELDYSDTELRVSVADTGRGVLPGLTAHGEGNGLIGMRERVELYDGDFAAGPRPGGGYQVVAVLPLDAAAQRPRVASAETPMGAPLS